MGIRLKIAVFLGIALALAFGVSNLFYMLRAKDLLEETSSSYGAALREATFENARNIFTSLEHGTADSLERGEMQQFDGLLVKLGQIEGVEEIGLTDTAGQILYSNHPERLRTTMQEDLFRRIVEAEGRLVEEDARESVLFARGHHITPDCRRCHIDFDLGELIGVLFVRYDLEELRATESAMAAFLGRTLTDNLVTGALTGTGGLLLAAGGIFLLLGRTIVRPLTQVVSGLREVAEGGGDLTRELEVRSRDEVGQLAENFNQFLRRQREMVDRVRVVSRDLLSATEEIRASAEEVSRGAVSQTGALKESEEALQGILADINGIAESTGSLVDSSKDSTSATLELGATIEEVAGQMERLFQLIEQVTSSNHQMSATGRNINENLEHLSSLGQATAAAVTSLDERIAQIEQNAEGTGTLTRKAASDADRGMEAVTSSISGIEALHDILRDAGGVVHDLGEQSGAIGNILSVIDDVAEQTNLLALNASIIAAQAGEHGKSFGVVANEIRDLAGRTASSTGEITEIITRLQQATGEAVEVMEKGWARARQEVERAREAGEALGEIRHSTEAAQQQVQEIVTSTHDQARESREITGSVREVTDMLGRIASAMQELGAGIQETARASEQMKEIARNVKASTEEQTISSRHIGQNMETMRDMIDRIDHASQDQTQRSRKVVSAVGSIHGIAETNAERTVELDKVVEKLRRQAKALDEEVGSFTT